jgi:hypothetical protein
MGAAAVLYLGGRNGKAMASQGRKQALREVLEQPLNHAIISNPGLSWAIRKQDKQLFYPAFMEGTW